MKNLRTQTAMFALLLSLPPVFFGQAAVPSSPGSNSSGTGSFSEITVPSSEEDHVSHQSIVNMRNESGWLLVERKTSEAEVEWQVVLAKIVPNLVPKAEVLTKPPGLKITYGPYFVRERLGFLRIFREQKSEERWPWNKIYIPQGGQEYGWAGSEPRIRASEEDKWCWVNSGPAVRPDVAIRLEHVDFRFPGHGAESGAITRFFFGQTQVRDEGDLLIADRSLPDHVALKQRERRFREEMANKPAPSISAQRWINREGDLSWRGLMGKVVLLDFWGQWCGPCVQKLPHSQALYEKYRDRGLIVIGIHSLHGNEKVERFIKQKRLSFPIALDDGDTQKQYFVDFWPSYFLVDKRGLLTWGFSAEPPSEAQIEELLKK